MFDFSKDGSVGRFSLFLYFTNNIIIRFFPINDYRIHRLIMIFLCYFCDKPKENIMKKILFILFAAQFILAPYMYRGESRIFDGRSGKENSQERHFWEYHY